MASSQISAGIPFMLDEPKCTKTFRIGLFGIDRLYHPQASAKALEIALDKALPYLKRAAFAQ